jgi:geranylgeranyl diphosphate synthase, type I
MKTTDTDVFRSKLAEYKQLIDEDIEKYAKYIQRHTLEQHGSYSRVAVDAYLDVLGRGGKRIRGALVMLGYEMSGGTDRAMIVQAARAIEMVHAYVLIIDDINDRSVVRRGKPAAHVMMAAYYNEHNFGDDAQHFGETIAMNGAILGNHAAQMIMANLNAPQDLRLNAISILNRGMGITIHGQFNDVFNQVIGEVTEKQVNNVTTWKTAHYTFLNPLHIGMILAGADCHATDAITEYAMNTGNAFQITDDILGIFGEQHETGKSPMDDIREGKRTVLTVYALAHTDDANKNFLIQMLGNQHLTSAEFERCKDILVQSGALEYAQKQVKHYVHAALSSLAGQSKHWSPLGTQFLQGLANYLLVRQS